MFCTQLYRSVDTGIDCNYALHMLKNTGEAGIMVPLPDKLTNSQT